MVQQIYSDIENLKVEVRKLRGRLNSISVGGQVTTTIPGTSPMPPPQQGATIAGNTTPAWQRVPPPAPTGTEEYFYTFMPGDVVPVWRLVAAPAPIGQYRQFVYEVSAGTFTFVTDAGGAPIFALLDLE